MKKSLIAAAVIATLSFGSSAMAQTIGNSPQVLDLTGTSGFFGDAFAANNSGSSFADRFTFAVPTAQEGSPGTTVNAIVSSISGSSETGLDITGLSLYSATGNTLHGPGSRQLLLAGQRQPELVRVRCLRWRPGPDHPGAGAGNLWLDAGRPGRAGLPGAAPQRGPTGISPLIPMPGGSVRASAFHAGATLRSAAS
jgi:hypothetical protein